MKRIVYGVAGEGLGHATRAHSLIEELGESCDVHVFTFGEAHRYFIDRLGDGALRINLYEIPGLRFGRGKSERITRSGTVKSFLDYRFRGYQNAVRQVVRNIQRLEPSVIITDFEPATAEAGRQMGVPVVSVDNQHKFAHFSSDELSLGLRVYCNFTGWFTERYIGRTDGCVVSTFYHEHGRSNSKIVKTNVFLRNQVRTLQPADEGHVLVYWKPSVGPEMLYHLRDSPLPVKVFGPNHSSILFHSFGPADLYRNFTYHPLDYSSFAEALAGCRALFCASGNQLLGEACYFSKPVFTVPEPNQQEQSVNAYYAAKMGFAETHKAGTYDRDTVIRFLDTFKARPQSRVNGVEVAADVIRSFARR